MGQEAGFGAERVKSAFSEIRECAHWKDFVLLACSLVGCSIFEDQWRGRGLKK